MSDKQWLSHLGEDRDWFIHWIAFGQRPVCDCQETERFDKCWNSLSQREREECNAVSLGNDFDIIYGRQRAAAYIKERFEIIKNKYESGLGMDFVI